MHGSAIAILMGLLLAYMGGVATGGKKGIADIECLAGIGLMGGAMLRDLAIVATAFGVRLDEFLKTGLSGIVSLVTGILTSFVMGALVAYAFGYQDAVSMTTIGGGAATYIVGPVTGTALGASSEVIALSVAAGLVKSMLVMTMTPLVASWIGLDNPRSALIFGGLMGTTSGVAGGLAATDEKLVPYGAMTATFYTGLGCLVGPSVVFIAIRAIVET
jgi:malonate transporter MadM subunit